MKLLPEGMGTPSTGKPWCPESPRKQPQKQKEVSRMFSSQISREKQKGLCKRVICPIE